MEIVDNRVAVATREADRLVERFAGFYRELFWIDHGQVRGNVGALRSRQTDGLDERCTGRCAKSAADSADGRKNDARRGDYPGARGGMVWALFRIQHPLSTEVLAVDEELRQVHAR